MKTYGELDLQKIREDCGLDFARHTYSRGQCSCCYGSLDMSARYWAKGKKPKRIYNEQGWYWDRDTEHFTYILFKNADNGSGHIKSLDEKIQDYTCIEYRFKDQEQKLKVCEMLSEQLGCEYNVEVPASDEVCIIIRTIGGCI